MGQSETLKIRSKMNEQLGKNCYNEKKPSQTSGTKTYKFDVLNKKFGHVLLVATSEWMRKKTPCWSVDLAKNNLVIAIWNYYHRQQSYTILTIDNDDDDDQPSSRLYGFDHSSHSFIHWIQFIVMNNNNWFMFSSTLHYHHVYGIWNWVKKKCQTRQGKLQPNSWLQIR